MGGFASYAERIDAQKVRARSASFLDHFSQASLFYDSQSEPEKNHIIRALRFELGKVETPSIRERMLGLLAEVDKGLARSVAEFLDQAKADAAVELTTLNPATGEPMRWYTLQPGR